MAYPVAFLGIAKSAALVATGLFLFSQARKKKGPPAIDDLDEGDGPAIDFKVLEIAEQAAAKTIEDQRRELGSKYILWARLPSQSVSQEEISQWHHLAKKGSVRAKALFDSSVYSRGMRTMRADGFFELYVHADDKAKLEGLELDLKS